MLVPFLMIGLAVVLAVVDQIIKAVVVQNLKPIGTYVVIEGLLDFTFVENRGAAFGILSNQRWFCIITTGLLMLAILILLFRYRHHNWITYLASGLILGGGLGNMIDRIGLGYVVDYIHVSFFPPVFNFADMAIVVGTALFIIHVLFFSEKASEERVLRSKH